MTISTAAVTALKKVPFFSKLSPEKIFSLAKRLVIRRFGPNQVVFHLGDPAGLLYIITDGKVKISHASAEGHEAVLAILGEGDFFGELALLDDSPRSATAEAIEVISVPGTGSLRTPGIQLREEPGRRAGKPGRDHGPPVACKHA